MADLDQQKFLDRLLNAGGITPSLEMEKVNPRYGYTEKGKRVDQCTERSYIHCEFMRVPGARFFVTTAGFQVTESGNIGVRTSQNELTENPA